jgi:hypothetical protein
LKPPSPYPNGAYEAVEYLARAEQFRAAAISLVDIGPTGLNWPKYALLGHAAELAFKAVATLYEAAGHKYPGHASDHDLVGQYERARHFGLAPTDLINERLPELSDLHFQHYARYPKPLGAAVSIPSYFDDLVDDILREADKIVRRRS